MPLHKIGTPFTSDEILFTHANSSQVVCVLDERLCQMYQEMQSAHVLVNDTPSLSGEREKPVAFMVSVPIPIKVKPCVQINGAPNDPLKRLLTDDYIIFDDTPGCYHITGYSCNLLVDESKRKLGWAAHPIKQMIDYGSKEVGVYSGYHVTSHKMTPASIPLRINYRVIDVKKAKDFGYQLFPQSLSTPTMKKMWLRPHLFKKKYIRITPDNASQYYYHYQKFCSQFSISHSPSSESWSLSCKHDYIYSIEGGGLVGFHKYSLRSNAKQVDVAVILFATDPEYIKVAFIESAKEGVAACYIYSLGNLANSQALAGLRTIEAAQGAWFNTYGMNGVEKLTAADIQLPFI